MTIRDLLDIYDGPVCVKAVTGRSIRKVVDTRYDEDFPFDIMDKKIYDLYINGDIASEDALTIVYEEA